MPSIVIDDQERVSVAFYDDRRFPTQQDSATKVRFDVYYAWAPLDSLDFSAADRNRLLFLVNPLDPADPPAFNSAVQPFDPHEYNGITWWGNTVWATYAGVEGEQMSPTENDAVIWSTRIDWTQQP